MFVPRRSQRHSIGECGPQRLGAVCQSRCHLRWLPPRSSAGASIRIHRDRLSRTHTSHAFPKRITVHGWRNCGRREPGGKLRELDLCLGEPGQGSCAVRYQRHPAVDSGAPAMRSRHSAPGIHLAVDTRQHGKRACHPRDGRFHVVYRFDHPGPAVRLSGGEGTVAGQDDCDGTAVADDEPVRVPRANQPDTPRTVA